MNYHDNIHFIYFSLNYWGLEVCTYPFNVEWRLDVFVLVKVKLGDDITFIGDDRRVTIP